MRKITILQVLTLFILYSCQEQFNPEIAEEEIEVKLNVRSEASINGLSYADFISAYFVSGNYIVPTSYISTSEDNIDGAIVGLYNQFSGNSITNIDEMPNYAESTLEATESQFSSVFPNFDNLNSSDITKIQEDFPSLNLSTIQLYEDFLYIFYQRIFEYHFIDDHVTYLQSTVYSVNQSSGLYPDGMCPEEIRFVKRHPLMALPLLRAKKDTDNFITAIYGVDLLKTDNIKANAVKHAMWNYLISQRIGNTLLYSRKKGRKIAKEVTDIHEECGDGGAVKNAMDYHNNLLGRDLHKVNSTFATSQLFAELAKHEELADCVPWDVSMIESVPRTRLAFLHVYNGSQGQSISCSNDNIDDQYLYGDFNGDGTDDIAVRRNNLIVSDTDLNGYDDFSQSFGNGNNEDDYLVGDINGDGTDDIILRRNNEFLADTDRNGYVDFQFWFGYGNTEDQYLIGDINGDGTDDIIVRRNNEFLSDTDKNGYVDFQWWFGNGNAEDQYLIGDINGDGTDDILLRRDNDFETDSDRNGYVDITRYFGYGNLEYEYILKDWNGDGIDDIAARRDNKILSDTNLNGYVDYTQWYGYGIAP
ncbi:MAG: VCBS repeat-containing protein [Roseivirga sp.]|jgi:hypothetical protein|uniref:FG-GAP repeat domain-containing protein n=1 Tax=Roseivirga sp. TaxID=1964215 RepID=UPI001B2EBF66|nr:VCBS repeat-containing protein [Roseivirga sp.]MBO6497531.1 VCBS repeat-containing protein [Roseivirga sp.]